MKISVGTLRISTILAVAVLSGTAAHAQAANLSNSAAVCADVKPPAVNPVDEIANVPLYVIQPGAASHQAICRATEALAKGMVDVEFNNDALLADALGDPLPDTDTGKVSEFPYAPEFPFFSKDMEVPEHHHVYAAFVDPETGVEYTYSAVGESDTDLDASGVQWITSTVEPLLEHRPVNANALEATDTRFAAAAAAVGTPTYDTRAWNILIDATIAMPNNKPAGGKIEEYGKKWDRVLGSSGARVRVYRLNGSKVENDYFLVDTTYSQNPAYDPFDFPVFLGKQYIYTWANRQTDLTLMGSDPNHSSTIQPVLSDFAPRTKIISTKETFTVGGSLGASLEGAGPGVSAGYSVTRTQESVDTSVKGDVGTNDVHWTDTYNGFGPNAFGGVTTTPTSTGTFTGETLAIFQVRRTVNDLSEQDKRAGKLAGLNFAPSLESHVQGIVAPFYAIFGGWNISSLLFAPEPRFSASPTTITVSKSANLYTPVIVNVVAQLPSGAQKVTWTPQITSTSIDTNVHSSMTGNGKLEVFPTATAIPGVTHISLQSSPPAATDSLRNGPVQITVKITD